MLKLNQPSSIHVSKMQKNLSTKRILAWISSSLHDFLVIGQFLKYLNYKEMWNDLYHNFFQKQPINLKQ